MKKIGKIAWRCLLGVFVAVYVLVAVANYSVVQSYLGTMAGHYLSREWGGEVHVGALHAMPWQHLMADDLRLVSPDGDTLLTARSLRVRFDGLPYRDHRIKLSRVMLRDAYYHLAVYPSADSTLMLTNLQYIFDHYQIEGRQPPQDTFIVDVGYLTISHTRYKMDLEGEDIPTWDEGVDIAHMDFHDINTRARNIHVVNDDVSVQLLKLSTTERSGMRVDHVEADVHVSPHDITVRHFDLRTPQSEVKADVEILWDGWGGDGDYLGNVQHRITLHPGTSVAIADAAYWAPMLWGIDATIAAEGHLDGTINQMHITDLMAHWGEASMLQMTGDVEGLPDIAHTVFDIDIQRLRTDRHDVQSLGITHSGGRPPQAHYARLDIPDMLLQQTGFVDLNMRLHGGYASPTTLNMQVESALGNVHADALLRPKDKGGARFNAEVGSSGLGLKLLRTDWLSHTGFDMRVDGAIGRWDDLRTLQADMEGQLTGSVVRGQRLAPIELEGKMKDGRGTLSLESLDSIALLAAEADFDLFDTTKRLTCTVHAQQVDAERLGLVPSQFSPIATTLDLHYEGRNLDSMQALLRMDDTRMGDARMERLVLSAESTGRNKNIRLQSDAVEATVGGHFDLLDLPLIGLQLMHEALPQDLFPVDTLYPSEREQLATATLGLHLQWHDRTHLLQAFVPSLTLADGTRVDATYTPAEHLKLVMRSDSIRVGTVSLEGVGLQGRTENGALRMQMESQEVNVGQLALARHALISTESNSEQASLQIGWMNHPSSHHGDLMLRLKEGAVQVERDEFTIANQVWHLGIDSLAVARTERFSVSGQGIRLHSDRQSLSANIALCGQPSDNVELFFHHFQLQGLTDVLLQQTPVALAAEVGGRFSLYGIGAEPYFNANMTLDSCIINRQSLGTMQLISHWNAEQNTAHISLTGQQLAADGWVELGGEAPEISLGVDFDSLNLALIAPLMSSFSDQFEGKLHGSLDIMGQLAHPLIEGEAQVEQGRLRINATGVTYLLDDELQFSNNIVQLDRFHIRDERGNEALVDGTIRLDSLTDVRLDLRLQTDRLLVLNQRNNDEYYGTLLAAATGTVAGPLDSLRVDVQARTVEGCTLTVPVNDRRQVKAQNYITFVSDKPTQTATNTPTRKQNSMQIDLDLTLTPDLQLNLPMDFSEATVGISANGMGDLHLSMAGTDEPQVVGSYEITSGAMKVGLLSLLTKTFTLEEGSNLQFQGSLPDARFDISAVYSQRVNLGTLTGNLDEITGAQRLLQVEDVLNVTGTLREPSIGFDIRLPGADASVEEEVFAYIDRNNERDMLTQALSLLVSGHFYNANASTVNGSLATSNGLGALSSVLTDMVTVVDIDLDYKAGNELTRDQVDLNISKDWGRWYLESTLGYGGESRELQASEASSAVVDALLGYRISPLVHLFAYNRTNTNDYTRNDLPYKQGVGLKLTKDFDRWTDLFRKTTP